MQNIKKKLNNCVFFYPKENTTNNYKKKNNYRNLLVENSFWIRNELTNIYLIYNLPNYSSYFFIPEKTTNIHYVEYDEDHYSLDSGKYFNYDSHNILFKFKNTQLIYFETYLKTNIKQMIFRLITGFDTILSSLEIISNLHLVHNNINMETILYDEISNRLIITNFRFSINMDYDINKRNEYLKHFFNEFNPSNNELPIEFHLISYMITNKLVSLSAYNIEYVINEVLKHSILHKFGKSIIDNFVSSFNKYFQKYINKSLDDLIIDITKYSYTWDTYALSFLYLNILIDLRNGCVFKENKFIILFMKLLVNNLQLTPEKRYSSRILLNHFCEMIDQIDKQTYLELI